MENKNTTHQFPEKWAIELYPEVKKWIENEYQTNCYSEDPKNNIFHFPNWRNGNGFLKHWHTSNIVEKGYTQITLEQFKKHFLKEKTMKKEIVGYKLIKPEYRQAALGLIPTSVYLSSPKLISKEGNNYLDSTCATINNLRKAGVLDLWFEPVYEEEFKVGDWVTFEVDKCVGRLSYLKTANWDRNITVPIDSITYDSFKFNGDTMNKYAPHVYWSGASNSKEVFRKATPEEIEAAKAAKKQIIKMHSSNKGEFEIEIVDGKAYYRPENKELPKEWIKDIIDIFGEQGGMNYPYKLEVKSVKVGCMEGTRKEDWEKVYKLLK